MKLSTKGRYGARLMLDLAVNYNNKPVLLKDIAKRQDISEKYLGQLVRLLKAANLVKSSRGAKGGYYLARTPDKITLKEIIESLEGTLDIVECVNSPGLCSRMKSCLTREIWCEITDKVGEILQGITLEDMRSMHKTKNDSITYNI